MRIRTVFLWFLFCVSCFGISAAWPGEPPENLRHSTFSLCAIDPARGQSGVAVTTRVPFVGRAVPWARAGAGAVATQSWTVVEYGPQGLDLLENGVEPEKALEILLANDKGRELRQIGIIDTKGRTVAFTGSKNGSWAGSRQGKNYTVQGNVLVGPEVVDAVADNFESTAGIGMDLAERMILALEAGQQVGGDKRWGYFQSAAIRVADPDDPGRGGDHLSLSIDVGEHSHPVQEMKRIYYQTARRLGYRSFSEIEGPDVVELKRMLHKAGYWRPGKEAIPEEPEWDLDLKVMRVDPERFQEAVAEYEAATKRFMDRFGAYDEETVQAVEAFRKERGLDHDGNARGLVDKALVDALRGLYYKVPPRD